MKLPSFCVVLHNTTTHRTALRTVVALTLADAQARVKSTLAGTPWQVTNGWPL